MKLNYDVLGKHIQLVDMRNKDNVTDRVLGINIDKYFMPSVANVIGTDLTRYKLIQKGQFACNPMHVGRDERLPVSLYTEESPAIVSPAYFMFEIIDTDILNPEYLMMWFKRPEFDRICWLKTDSSVRGGITWDDICRMELPVPSLEEQIGIVQSYKAITVRIALKQQINDNLLATAQSIFQSYFEEYEASKVENASLPIGWKATTLSEVLSTSTASINPQKMTVDKVWHYSIPAFDSEHLPVSDNPSSILSNKYIVAENSILVSKLNPDTKRIWLTLECFKNAICSTEFIMFVPNIAEHKVFYYLLFNTPQFIDFLVSNATGSTNSRMRVKPTSSLEYEYVLPPNNVLNDFCEKVTPLIRKMNENLLEIRKLYKALPIIVAKLMSSSH